MDFITIKQEIPDENDLAMDFMAAEETGGNEEVSWQSQAFRQLVVNNMQETISLAIISKENLTELEKSISLKSKTKEEYLSLVACINIHIRETIQKNLNASSVELAIKALENFSSDELEKIPFQPQVQESTSSVQNPEGTRPLVPQISQAPQTCNIDEDNSWRSASFRQSVVNKINEAIRSSDLTPKKNTYDMENHLFSKARNKDEYLSFVARLIIHYRGMNKNHRRGINGAVSQQSEIITSAQGPQNNQLSMISQQPESDSLHRSNDVQAVANQNSSLINTVLLRPSESDMNFLTNNNNNHHHYNVHIWENRKNDELTLEKQLPKL